MTPSRIAAVSTLRLRTLAPNGEVEGPDDNASQRPRARNIDWVPRPQTDHASRPPPTIVRLHGSCHRANAIAIVAAALATMGKVRTSFCQLRSASRCL